MDLGSCKPLGSTHYALCRWEDGKTFYLVLDGQEPSGGGVIDGAVEMMGYNNDVIVARRYATFRGDPDGWMVVDVKRKSARGPVADEEVKAMFPTLQLKSAKDEWNDR